MLRPSRKAGKAVFHAAVQQFSRDRAQRTLESVTYSGINRNSGVVPIGPRVFSFVLRNVLIWLMAKNYG
jgi:hypothetical protein